MILEPNKIKSVTVSTVSPSGCQEVKDGAIWLGGAISMGEKIYLGRWGYMGGRGYLHGKIYLGGEGYLGGQDFLDGKGRGWIWKANGRYPANMQGKSSFKTEI